MKTIIRAVVAVIWAVVLAGGIRSCERSVQRLSMAAIQSAQALSTSETTILLGRGR